MPPLLDEDLYDEARAVEESDGREMARRLATEEGLLAGTSTGLNVAGAIGLARELGPGHTVVTVAVESQIPGRGPLRSIAKNGRPQRIRFKSDSFGGPTWT